MSQQPITMPGLSDTMQSGHLVRWLKKPGDKINKGDIIAEVESDKAVMDVESFGEGYLSGPLAQEDSDYQVGAVLAYLTDELESAEQKPAQEKNPAEAAPANAPVQKPAAVNEPSAPHKAQEPPQPIAATLQAQAPHQAEKQQTIQRRVSPYARGLAQELGVDLATVATNEMGIIKSPQVISAALRGPLPNLDAGPAWRYKLFTPMHRAIADHMQATVSTPTFRVSAMIHTEVLHQMAHDMKLSFSLLMARFIALTTVKHPNFNAAYTPFGLALRDRVDVGIAMDLPAGLVTPVLRDMAQRPMEEIAKEWAELQKKAKSQRLQPQHYQGATIYLSNLGMFKGITHFDAIVPTGACAILALGAPQNGVAEMTLTADHRVVYGADAARFLQTLNKKLDAARDNPDFISNP